MSFKAALIFLSFLACVSALTTHQAHRGVHHRALAGRLVVPDPIAVPGAPLRKRQNSKRCKPRPSASGTTQPASSNPPPSPSTSTNAAPKPPLTTAHAAAKPPSPTPTPEKPTPAPQPTHTTVKQEQPPATTEKPSPPPASNLPSYLIGTQTGDGTFYQTGLGACGIINNNNDKIAAVSHLLFDTFPGYDGVNPNNNPICGRKVTASYQGKSVTVAITDRCTGCDIDALDFSPSAFDVLSEPAVGRIHGMTWVWD